MAKTLEQRIAQLEKLITDFFTGGSPTARNPRKPAQRKPKKPKTTKKPRRKAPRKSSRK